MRSNFAGMFGGGREWERYEVYMSTPMSIWNLSYNASSPEEAVALSLGDLIEKYKLDRSIEPIKVGDVFVRDWKKGPTYGKYRYYEDIVITRGVPSAIIVAPESEF